jgi:hypothetical protein
MARLIFLGSLPSRRRVLGAAVVLSTVGIMAQGASAAPVMRSQKVVNYQTTPKGRSRCDNCSEWVAPDACKIVSGKITPSGWCSAYAPKP